MKKWESPVMEMIDIKETACGGTSVTKHDGCIYEVGNTVVEEYFPLSGQEPNCQNPNK